MRSQPGLLARFRRGDRDALAEVYWAYVDRVEHVVRHGFVLGSGSRVAGASPSEIADLVQEVFARAFTERARLGYDGLRDYAPYLQTIARNLLVDRARKLGREISLDAVAELDKAIADEAPPPSWAAPEVVAVVSAYIETLPPELAGVHRERFVRGASQEAAARALGLSRQQLRTLETKLRDGLATALRRHNLL